MAITPAPFPAAEHRQETQRPSGSPQSIILPCSLLSLSLYGGLDGKRPSTGPQEALSPSEGPYLTCFGRCSSSIHFLYPGGIYSSTGRFSGRRSPSPHTRKPLSRESPKSRVPSPERPGVSPGSAVGTRNPPSAPFLGPSTGGKEKARSQGAWESDQTPQLSFQLGSK